jgi:hypothetical protein
MCETLGALYVDQVSAAGDDLESAVPDAGYRVSGVSYRQHPVQRAPDDERRHVQDRKLV